MHYSQSLANNRIPCAIKIPKINSFIPSYNHKYTTMSCPPLSDTSYLWWF